MTPNDMLSFCGKWTGVTDQTKQLLALQKAYRWVVRRVFNSQDGPALLASVDEELPALLVVTKQVDLAPSLAHPLLAFKKLWVKLPADTKFVGMEPDDTNDPSFSDLDGDPASNIQEIAQGHPVLYDIFNFSQARFAPALPIGAVIRVDYYRLGTDIGAPDGDTQSHELNEQPVVGEDLPGVFDDAVTSKAVSLLFNKIDDDREASWEARALDEITDALYTCKRTQSPTQTQPFRRQRRRFI